MCSQNKFILRCISLYTWQADVSVYFIEAKRRISFTVNLSGTARALKNKIAEKGITVERQLLYLRHTVIADEKILLECGVRPGSALTVATSALPLRGGQPFFIPSCIVWREKFWYWYQRERWVYAWCSCGKCSASGWISDSGAV